MSKEGQTTTKNVLGALNDSKFTRFHLKAVLVAGVGFFTDAYDLFSINLVVPMIAYAYFDGKIPVADEAFLKGSAVFGTLLGQLGFGILGDVVGRKKIYGLELVLMILGSFGSAIAASTVTGLGVVPFICFWRFILGIGIGGDYPLSATITSEFANVSKRGMMIAMVFAMQGIGILGAGITAIVTVRAFKSMIMEDPLNADYCWRICLGVGCIPAAFTIYFRATIPESPRYTLEVEKDVDKSNDVAKLVASKSATNPAVEGQCVSKPAGDMGEKAGPKWKESFKYFGKLENFKILFATSACWFLLDIAFYGLALNQSTVLDAIGYSNSKDPYDKLFSLAVGNTIISLMGNVPGYWLSVLLIEKMGRIKIQLLGFGVLTVIFIILASGFNVIKDKSLVLFIFLYCLGQLFFNFGPNTTTFVIPGEVFPTKCRSTGHGISAASGKLGAIIASYGFTPLSKKENGIQLVIAIFAGIMFLGFLCTFMLPETKGRTLEDISGEAELPKKQKELTKSPSGKDMKENSTDLVTPAPTS